MDGQKFDSFTKNLADSISRRGMLKALLGGAAGGAAAALRSRGGQAADKVFICHNTGSTTNPQVLIEVSVNAIKAHKAHGDLIGVDVSSDPFNCGNCGVVCPGDACNTAVCSAGKCSTTPVNCDDGDVCTTDTCDPVTGCAHAPVANCCHTDADCDDDNACTTDTCVDNQCQHTDVICNDNDVCTEDTCDPATGCVNTPISNCCHDNSECNDNNACTVDTCVNNRCVFTPAGGTCSTGFGACGENPDFGTCGCVQTASGGTACVDDRPCNLDPECTTDADCTGPNEVCTINTCCNRNACIVLCGATPDGLTIGAAAAGPSPLGG
jgi:hypothetical protein